MKNKALDTTPQVAAIMLRLKTFLDHLNISMHKFGEQTNIAAGGVSRAINAEGKYSMGIDKFMNIFTTYPQLNPMWLLFGTGPMLNDDIPKGAPTYDQLHKQHMALQKEHDILRAKAETYVEVLQHLGQSLKKPSN